VPAPDQAARQGRLGLGDAAPRAATPWHDRSGRFTLTFRPARPWPHSWQIGKSLLDQAIAEGRDYRFEMTFGGRSISQLLERAARSGQ